MNNYNPGDTAMVQCSDGEYRRAGYFDPTFDQPAWVFADNTRRLVSQSMTRPLAVIDPEDREPVEQLRDLFVAAYCEQTGYKSTDRVAIANALQAALREFANPTPPRVWTDGDVVTSPLRAYHRQGRRWWPTRPSTSTTEGYRDSDMEEMLESDSCAVLREQAAEVAP